MWKLMLLPLANAFFLPITPGNGSPWVTLADGNAVQWNNHLTAALLDTSQGVRVGHRGLHFYDHSVHMDRHGRRCRRTHNALCELEDGSLVLPQTSPRFKAGTRSCEGWGRTLVRNDVYDISMCDVASGTSLIWVPTDGGRLWQQHDMGLGPWYIFTALIVLFLVLSLGQNIASILGDQDAETHPLVTEVLCLGQCCIIILQQNPYHVFLTSHDQMMFAVFSAYVTLYLVRHCFELVQECHVFTLNVITATLVLVTARLYGSFETPYAPIFVFLLGSRMWHKIIDSRGTLERLTVAIDTLILALYWRVGFRPSFWHPDTADIYGAALFTICFCTGIITQPPSGHLPQPEGCAVVAHKADIPTYRTHGGDAGNDTLRLNLRHFGCREA